MSNAGMVKMLQCVYMQFLIMWEVYKNLKVKFANYEIESFYYFM